MYCFYRFGIGRTDAGYGFYRNKYKIKHISMKGRNIFNMKYIH